MSNSIREGNMYAINAPGSRGHFAILVRVETPWLYFYDTIDKVYFMTTVSDVKRAMKLHTQIPMGRDDLRQLPYLDLVETIPDKIWQPLKSYCDQVMRKKAIKHRNFIKS